MAAVVRAFLRLLILVTSVAWELGTSRQLIAGLRARSSGTPPLDLITDLYDAESGLCGEGVWPAPLAVRLQHLDDDDGGAPEAVVELAGMLAGARACAVARVPLDYGVLAPCEGAAPPEAAATPQRHAVEPGALAAFVLHFVCETRPRPGAAG